MSTLERMKALADRKAKIDAQLAQLKRRQAANQRKEDTRLKVLIGAAVLADLKLNPQTGVFMQEVLQRAIVTERDRQFLRAKGWLPEEKSAGQ